MADVNAKRDADIILEMGGHRCTMDLQEEQVSCSDALQLERSLRLLSRWLLAAARKRAPVAHSGQPGDPQKRLDVVAEAKVGSEPENSGIPVKQALQRSGNR